MHSLKMHDSQEEKYLGDNTLQQIQSMPLQYLKRELEDFALFLTSHKYCTIQKSKKIIKVGFHLRKAWFINSLLVNMKAWHNVLKKRY